MKVSPSSLTLLLITSTNISSFTLHTKNFHQNTINTFRQTAVRTLNSRTRVSAGFTTDVYLSSLSDLPTEIPPFTGLSATDAYLNNIASFVIASNDESVTDNVDVYLSVPSNVIDESSLSSTSPVENIMSQISSSAEVQSSFIPVLPVETTTIPEATPTPENFFMAQVSSSSIDRSNDFMSYVPASTSETINEAVASTTAVIPEPTPDTTYYMKELTISSNDNVIGPVASDTTSNIVENAVTTPSTTTDQIIDSVVSKPAETANIATKAIEATSAPIKEAPVDELSNALSGMTYENLAQNAETAKLANTLQQSRLSIPSIDTKSIPSFDPKNIPIDYETINSALSDVQSATNTALQTSKTQLIEQGNEVAKEVGEVRLKQLGGIIIDGIQTFGKLCLMVIDDIANIFLGDKAPTTANVFSAAYASIAELINGASTTISNTIQDIGSMTVAQAAQSFVALVVLLVKLLFQLFDTIIQMITNGGTTLNTITNTAMTSITQQSDILTTRASSLSTDVGNIKLSELAGMTGSFLHYSTDVMGQTYAVVMEMAKTGNLGPLGDLGIDPSYFETFTTALSNLPSL